MPPDLSIPDLSIVVPCFNETHRLAPSLESIREWVAAQPFATEVVVVDDGSTDGTADLARAQLEGLRHRVLSHDRNRGKGAALRTGMLAAQGARVLFTDADLSTPIGEATRLLAVHDDGVPVAIGSRRAPGADITRHQSLLRESLGRVFTWLSRRLICPGIGDFTCGFKSFEAAAARAVFERLHEDGWAYDAEVLFLARRLGFAVREVPVPWANDPSTRVNMLRDGIGSFLGLLRIRTRAARGTYDI